LDKVLTSNAARALELLGAIERKDDPEDSRAWRLSVTEKGQKVFAEALASVKAVDARFFGPKADRLRDELAKLPLDSGAD
jgi:DNA-binding MarR family transcriptional regulator